VYIRVPEIWDVGWNLYLMPFSCDLWLAVVVAICVLSLCLALANCSPDGEKRDHSLSVPAVFLYIFGCLCQQGQIAIRSIYS